MTERLLVNRREAAAMLGVSVRHLWSLTYPRGPIRCVNVGKRVMYDPADLRTCLQIDM